MNVPFEIPFENCEITKLCAFHGKEFPLVPESSHVFFFARFFFYSASKTVVCFYSILFSANEHCCQDKNLISAKMLNKWFKVIGNSSPAMEPITCQSSDRSSFDSSEQSSIARLIDSSPSNGPFRKKAITSIERTRKLSILLKHQQYLVSY